MVLLTNRSLLRSGSSSGSSFVPERRVKSTPAAVVGTGSAEVSATSSGSSSSSSQPLNSKLDAGSDSIGGSGKGNETQTIFSFSSTSGVEDTSPKDDDLGDGWIEVRCTHTLIILFPWSVSVMLSFLCAG